MKYRKLSATQRDALETIKAVIRIQIRHLQAVIDSGEIEGAKFPSEYVSVATLTGTHKIRPATIRALVKAGVLRQRPTDGFGPEVTAAWRQSDWSKAT